MALTESMTLEANVEVDVLFSTMEVEVKELDLKDEVMAKVLRIGRDPKVVKDLEPDNGFEVTVAVSIFSSLMKITLSLDVLTSSTIFLATIGELDSLL